MHTPEETAKLVALLLKRTEKKRARISRKTLLRLSKRRIIRTVFLDLLKANLENWGLILIELERGGYGMIPSSALEGAPPITDKKYLQDVLRVRIRFPSIRKELEQDVDIEENDDDDGDEV